MKKVLSLFLFLPYIFLSGCGGVSGAVAVNDKDKLMEAYRRTVDEHSYIRHGLGGMQGKYALTNSREAFEYSYYKGFRLYEIDLQYTGDGVLVLAHGWTEDDYERFFGWDYNPDNPAPSYKEFQEMKVQNRYTTMAFSDFITLMETHADIYIMLDTGKIGKDYEKTKTVYEEIVSCAKSNDEVLQRLIVGGFNTGMIDAVRDTYDFTLYNLYFENESVRQDELLKIEDYIAYCRSNNITSFSTSRKIFETENLSERMKDSQLIQYVFTVNDKDKAAELLSIGASVIGTDFLE